MIYGIISDIHGNLEALLSVQKYLESHRVEKVICLGDIVGYGANPRECIKVVKKISQIILAGNHDFAVCGKTLIEDFNPYAKEAVLWSREVLNEEELIFLGNLPFKYEEDDTIFVHSSLHRPEAWRYLFDPVDTYKDFQIMEKNTLFVGHTHVPIIFEDDGIKVKMLNSPDLYLSPNNKYIINPGSVGQPRDRDPRASFIIYNSKERNIKRIRVEYNIKEAQRKIREAGLPEILATRLEYGG
ncbi:MAG: metallophosphoesterase family protein [candidate division WOR-3 bacterium]